MQFKKPAFLLLLFIHFLSLQAQELFFPLNLQAYQGFEFQLNNPTCDFHTDVKPFRENDVRRYANIDSINNSFYKSGDTIRTSLLKRKLRSESLIQIKNSFFDIRLDPLINVSQLHNFSDGDFGFVHAGGIRMRGSIKKQIAFEANYSENESSFFSYIDEVIAKKQALPGQGTPRKFIPGGNKNTFSYFSGYLSFTPSKHFNFQFGHDKNFFGDGYRSLLLSDNAAPYPFFKISTSIWKIKYVNLYTSMTDNIYPNNIFTADPYKRKNIAIHYLSYNIFRRVTISFFEAVVFRARDSTSYRGYDWNYLNPVIFLRPQEFSLSSSDNSLMGLNLKIKLSKHFLLYGQLMLDEFKVSEVIAASGWYANKHAFQAGFKLMNFLNVANLCLRGEYNLVRPFTYSHYNTLQSFTHNGQALAHPVGANFKEGIGILNYRIRSWLFELKASSVLYGESVFNPTKNKYENYGKDIFRSYLDHPAGDYGYVVAGGERTTVTYTDLKISYIINPNTNLCLEGGVQLRSFENSLINLRSSTIVYFGLKSNLNNLYYDF